VRSKTTKVHTTLRPTIASPIAPAIFSINGIGSGLTRTSSKSTRSTPSTKRPITSPRPYRVNCSKTTDSWSKVGKDTFTATFHFLFQHPIYALCSLDIYPTCGCLHITLSYMESINTYHFIISVHARMRGRVRGHLFIGPGSNCRSSDRPLQNGKTGHKPIVYRSHSMVTASTYAPIPSVHRDEGYETLNYTPMAHADPTSLPSLELVSCIFQNQDPLLPVPSSTQIIFL